MQVSCDRAQIQLAWGRDSGGRSHEQRGLREPEDPGKALGMPWSEMARSPASVAQLLREWRLKIHKVTPIQNDSINSVENSDIEGSKWTVVPMVDDSSGQPHHHHGRWQS